MTYPWFISLVFVANFIVVVELGQEVPKLFPIVEQLVLSGDLNHTDVLN